MKGINPGILNELGSVFLFLWQADAHRLWLGSAVLDSTWLPRSPTGTGASPAEPGAGGGDSRASPFQMPTSISPLAISESSHQPWWPSKHKTPIKMSLAIITAFIISRNLLGPSGQQSSSARHSSVTVQSGAKTRWLRLTQGKNNNNRIKKKKLAKRKWSLLDVIFLLVNYGLIILSTLHKAPHCLITAY